MVMACVHAAREGERQAEAAADQCGRQPSRIGPVVSAGVTVDLRRYAAPGWVIAGNETLSDSSWLRLHSRSHAKSARVGARDRAYGEIAVPGHVVAVLRGEQGPKMLLGRVCESAALHLGQDGEHQRVVVAQESLLLLPRSFPRPKLLRESR